MYPQRPHRAPARALVTMAALALINFGVLSPAFAGTSSISMVNCFGSDGTTTASIWIETDLDEQIGISLGGEIGPFAVSAIDLSTLRFVAAGGGGYSADLDNGLILSLWLGSGFDVDPVHTDELVLSFKSGDTLVSLFSCEVNDSGLNRILKRGAQ